MSLYDRLGFRGTPKRVLLLGALCALGLGLFAQPAAASHSWGDYHLSRSQNPFWVTLGDNVGASWDSYLGAAAADWSLDQVPTDRGWPADATPEEFFGINNPLNTLVRAGGTTGRKCRPSSGRVEACSAGYGYNGWLGLASIWVSGSHITQATVKLNDTYFNTATYNTPAWRQSVTCQEIGHTFGLGHQDESGADFDSCMDYSRIPNIHPDQHDYNMLASIYSHLDSATGSAVTTTPPAGRGLRRIREGLYVEDLGTDTKRFVWVFWKNPGAVHRADPADAG